MHSTGMDRQKQSGLWVVGFLLEGWAKSPRQDEAAAVVRLVWPAGCRAVRVAWLPTGPLRYRGKRGREQGRQAGSTAGQAWAGDWRVARADLDLQGRNQDAWGGLYEVQC